MIIQIFNKNGAEGEVFFLYNVSPFPTFFR